MSSFSSETLHPRARSAPLPSLCMSPSTQVAADQRAVGNRHHLFNRTVAPASWGLGRSVGFAAQSVARWAACGSSPSGDPCSFDSIFETRAFRRSCLDMHQETAHLHGLLNQITASTHRHRPITHRHRPDIPTGWQLGPTTGSLNPFTRS